MMNSHLAVAILLIGLWGFFVFRFVRAIQRRRITEPKRVHAWFVYLATYLVITLSVQPTIARVDALFGGAPASALLISILMLLTAQYVFMGLMIALRKLGERSTWVDEVFYAANPIVILTCTALFLNNAITQTYTSEALASILIAIRNAAIPV